jgi:hypothetical protein
MSDIFERVLSEQDPIKKILAKIPGFKGYIERGDRRMSDKLLREKVADEFEALYQRISSLQRDLISQGELNYVDDLEASALKLRQSINMTMLCSPSPTKYDQPLTMSKRQLGLRGWTLLSVT